MSRRSRVCQSRLPCRRSLRRGGQGWRHLWRSNWHRLDGWAILGMRIFVVDHGWRCRYWRSNLGGPTASNCLDWRSWLSGRCRALRNRRRSLASRCCPANSWLAGHWCWRSGSGAHLLITGNLPIKHLNHTAGVAREVRVVRHHNDGITPAV